MTKIINKIKLNKNIILDIFIYIVSLLIGFFIIGPLLQHLFKI